MKSVQLSMLLEGKSDLTDKKLETGVGVGEGGEGIFRGCYENTIYFLKENFKITLLSSFRVQLVSTSFMPVGWGVKYYFV